MRCLEAGYLTSVLSHPSSTERSKDGARPRYNSGKEGVGHLSTRTGMVRRRNSLCNSARRSELRSTNGATRIPFTSTAYEMTVDITDPISGGLHQMRSGNLSDHRESKPNTATPAGVPTYTFPFTMSGAMNLFPFLKLSRPFAAC